MSFHPPGAASFVPDGVPLEAALARTTHLGVGAHQDDLEFMAFHGIIACHDSVADWFGGVVCTDGAGSPRTGSFAFHDAAAMRATRRREQEEAARIGRYGVMLQLDHSSAAVKDPRAPALREELLAILRATHPRIVYTHNLADKHPTHVAVAMATLAALRALPSAERPVHVYGCEVWRDLDWLPDADKVVHDLTGHDALADTLNGAFASQIAGGKRYDLGVAGRRRAHATFLDSHTVDGSTALAFAMDLTPLVQEPSLDPLNYVDALLEKFRRDVRSKISACLEG